MTSWLTRSLSMSLVLAAGATHAGPGLELSLERARAMLVKEDIGDGVYVFRAPEALEYWTATNSVVVVGDDEVVVFDRPTRAITARAVIEEIRGLTSKPVRILINSHWHQDHWSGNDEYARRLRRASRRASSSWPRSRRCRGSCRTWCIGAR